MPASVPNAVELIHEFRAQISFSTAGTFCKPSSVLAVYTGSSVGTLNEVAGKDNGCGHQSRVVFRAQTRVRYKVAVDGRGEARGTFTLNFAEARHRPVHRRPASRGSVDR
jgi:hypothetical protein